MSKQFIWTPNLFGWQYRLDRYTPFFYGYQSDAVSIYLSISDCSEQTHLLTFETKLSKEFRIGRDLEDVCKKINKFNISL